MEPIALTRLREQRLLAVIRAPSPEAALGAAQAVARGGITLIEITFTVPQAARVMSTLRNQQMLAPSGEGSAHAAIRRTYQPIGCHPPCTDGRQARPSLVSQRSGVGDTP